ncbi:response regulator [Solicola sp. PLA-1-18]|uniref:response regulator n=1 Tax=Solicola sp. PLA-1-18 TaxID=3380532 RepID=UPI003B7F9C67
MHALIVDDSRAMRAILRRTLEPLGYTWDEAGHGQEALDVLRATVVPPDLMLVDWNMPVMDGLTLIREVRTEAAWRNITIMMVTTESEHTQVVRALAAGANEYLMKPFTTDAVVGKLDLLGLLPQEAHS